MNWRTLLLVTVIVAIVAAILVLENARAVPSSSDTQRENLSLSTAEKAQKYPSAVEIVNPSGFINTDSSFSLKNLIGKKVILLDFWTYSCINCIRTFPYLKKWYERYKDKGFEIVGIHTPEFGFEKILANVQGAVAKHGLLYPVVLDNDYGTWNAYGNRYWPRHYLIDIDGYIVEDHIGEGGYVETEEKIQELLLERGERLGESVEAAMPILPPADAEEVSQMPKSPEVYFGAARNESLGNGQKQAVGAQTLTFPEEGAPETLYLGGTWKFDREFAENITAGARILYRYQGNKLFFVGSAENPIKITVLRDGKPLTADIRGADVSTDSTVTVAEDRLYRLIEDETWGQHTIEIIIEKGGVRAFTFTFG